MVSIPTYCAVLPCHYCARNNSDPCHCLLPSDAQMPAKSNQSQSAEVTRSAGQSTSTGRPSLREFCLLQSGRCSRRPKQSIFLDVWICRLRLPGRWLAERPAVTVHCWIWEIRAVQVRHCLESEVPAGSSFVKKAAISRLQAPGEQCADLA